MTISVADAKNHLSELLRSVEEGEEVIITRNGGKIHPKPGWDAPIDLDRFLADEL